MGICRNHYLIGAVLFSMALQLLAIHASFLQQAFQTTALGIGDWVGVYLFPAPFCGLWRPTSVSFDVVSQQWMSLPKSR